MYVTYVTLLSYHRSLATPCFASKFAEKILINLKHINYGNYKMDH